MTTLTSALPGVMVVPAVDVFGVLGSVDVVVAFAVLLSRPSGALADTLAVMVNVAVAPDAMLAFVQVMVPLVPTLGLVQMNAGPLFCAVETNVVFAGSASVSETLVAGFGPLFVSEMLYVTFVPCAAVAVAVLVIDRLAVKITFVFAVELLLPGTESVDEVDTEAVLLTVAGAAGPLTLSVKMAEPTAIDPMVQLMEPTPFTAGVVQVQPTGEASDANVVPAGTVSANVALMAGLPPLFVTVIV